MARPCPGTLNLSDHSAAKLVGLSAPHIPAPQSHRRSDCALRPATLSGRTDNPPRIPLDSKYRLWNGWDSAESDSWAFDIAGSERFDFGGHRASSPAMTDLRGCGLLPLRYSFQKSRLPLLPLTP